ncbi:unnamed protein product [Symbiodinium sp. CCMP2592]|nr:unnamed protein product [Symbiodinium sp. CCMP2592]
MQPGIQITQQPPAAVSQQEKPDIAKNVQPQSTQQHPVIAETQQEKPDIAENLQPQSTQQEKPDIAQNLQPQSTQQEVSVDVAQNPQVSPATADPNQLLALQLAQLMQGLTMNSQGPSETRSKLLRPGTVDFTAAATAFMNVVTAAGSGSGSVQSASGVAPGEQVRAVEPAQKQEAKQELQGGQGAGESSVSDEELEEMEKQVQEHRLKQSRPHTPNNPNSPERPI